MIHEYICSMLLYIFSILVKDFNKKKKTMQYTSLIIWYLMSGDDAMVSKRTLDSHHIPPAVHKIISLTHARPSIHIPLLSSPPHLRSVAKYQFSLNIINSLRYYSSINCNNKQAVQLLQSTPIYRDNRGVGAGGSSR